jgi:branched chain amino acid efflux pump
MRVDLATLATWIGMMVVTYVSRAGGYWLIRRFSVGGRLKAGLEAVPLAVLTALIAPTVLATGPAETLAALATLLLAWRLPILVAILGGVAAVVLLRGLLG